MSERYYDPSGGDITDKVNESLGKNKKETKNKNKKEREPKIHRIPVIPYDPKTEANDNE